MTAKSDLAATIAMTIGGGAVGAFAYVVITQTSDNSWVFAFATTSILVVLCLIAVGIAQTAAVIEEKSLNNTKNSDNTDIVLAIILSTNPSEQEATTRIANILGDIHALKYIRSKHKNSLEEARVVLENYKGDGS
jgi:hypothetical protein